MMIHGACLQIDGQIVWLCPDRCSQASNLPYHAYSVEGGSFGVVLVVSCVLMLSMPKLHFVVSFCFFCADVAIDRDKKQMNETLRVLRHHLRPKKLKLGRTKITTSTSFFS